jgi:hypothetical protein
MRARFLAIAYNLVIVIGDSPSPKARLFLKNHAFVEIDDLAPVRTRVYPAPATALCAFEVSADIVPIPVRKVFKSQSGIVPTARPVEADRRTDAVNEDGFEPAANPSAGRPFDQ